MKLMAGSALAACAPAKPRLRTLEGQSLVARFGIRAVAFDLFTIFDPRGVDRRVADLFDDGDPAAFATTWKTRLFEYSWLRAASGRYADFTQLVDDALRFAARAHSRPLSDEQRQRLAATFTELVPWPDAPQVLHGLRERGLRLAPLANFAPRMIEDLLQHAGLRDLFECLISTDQARTYKPDPRAYALGEASFGLERRQIAFAAFGSWDAAGARWYGYPTFWVNRLGTAPDELIEADATGPDLVQLAAWIA